MEYYRCEICGCFHEIKEFYPFDGYLGESSQYEYKCDTCHYKIQAPREQIIKNVLKQMH